MCDEKEHSDSGCGCQQAVASVHQSLDELDFERGIWTAALDNDEGRVRWLVSRGTSVDARDKAGYTALHYAARSGHVSMCRLLLSCGAEVNTVTRAGQATALHRAAMAGQEKVVELLLQAGADGTLRDADGLTAADRARLNHHHTVLRLLS